MKCISHFVFLVLWFSSLIASGQKKPVPIGLHTLAKNHQLQPVGREPAAFSEPGKKWVRFSEKDNDGLPWIKGITFSNGIIELDIKGRDVPQQSFVGVAFHGADEKTMDIVYFRPFNFRTTDSVRRIHAVQYVSAPDFGWQRLRQEQNGKFEKAIVPAPAGNDWFHARIVVHNPQVSVYVNGNTQPSLTVEKLNARK